jgi:hypothetical protein
MLSSSCCIRLELRFRSSIAPVDAANLLPSMATSIAEGSSYGWDRKLPDPAGSPYVIAPEVRNRLEVRRKPARQPISSTLRGLAFRRRLD